MLQQLIFIFVFFPSRLTIGPLQQLVLYNVKKKLSIWQLKGQTFFFLFFLNQELVKTKPKHKGHLYRGNYNMYEHNQVNPTPHEGGISSRGGDSKKRVEQGCV